MFFSICFSKKSIYSAKREEKKVCLFDVDNLFRAIKFMGFWSRITGILEIKSPACSYYLLCPVWDCACELLKLLLFFLKVYYRVEEEKEEKNDIYLVSVNETFTADAGAQQENFKESAYVEDNDIDANPSNV